MIQLTQPVAVGNRRVVGYDPALRQPVLDAGPGSERWTLAQMQRAAWDEDEERFTPDELAQISDAIGTLHLPPELVNGTHQP